MADLSGVALILGASSGFGAAAARALAREGMDIVGVHLDRRSTLPMAQAVAEAIRGYGRRALFFNLNAADDTHRATILDAIQKEWGAASVRVLMHSIAFGTLKPLAGENAVTRSQLEMTMDVMANSLVYWSGDLVRRGLLMDGGRIFAMTSSGGTRAIAEYGPVGAAKAALEAYCRQLALELGPRRITVNAIRAGVTNTPAVEKIPGAQAMMQFQSQRNPGGRLTTPEDVAEAIALLTRPGAGWVSGNTLGIDGGEDIVA
jgi:NAD(P)-dependent dehydrogenase (short-subunit alcohol dehydrogenase family)